VGAAQEPGARLSASAPWRRAWPFAAALLAYVGLRIYGFADVTTLLYRDSDSYLEVARQPVFSSDFWAGARPWTVPLLYKLLPDTNGARTAGQLVVSILCWSALAVSVARCLRPRAAAVAGFALVLAFSLVFAVIRWDRLVLSESVSISLTAAVLAAWLWLVRSPGPRAVVGVLAITLLWVFTRDSNGLLAALTALPALAWAVRPGAIDRRWPVLLTVGLGAIFALNLASTGTEEAKLRRQERPILHVVGRRVLANPGQEAYFRRHGMPAPPPRVRRHRHELAAIGVTVPSDPATDAFLRWVHERGRVTLARYLVTHPGQTVGSVVRFRKRLLRGVTIGYRPPDAREVLPERLASALYPERPRSVVLWLAIVLVAAGATAVAAGPSRLWLVPLAAIALQLPHAILVYHGDTLEVPRHAVVMAITLRLAILLLAVLVAGRALERWLEARARGSS
jgi:hypothetical protein